MIKYVLSENSDTTFTIFYGNKQTSSVMFLEEIESLKNKYLDRLQIYYIFSREKVEQEWMEGRIDKNKCDFIFKYLIHAADQIENVFLCGPFQMIQDLREVLPNKNVVGSKIKFELFYNPNADEQKPRAELKQSIDKTISITMDGMTTQVHSNYDLSILDIADDAGLDVPYSCKGGVCSTCKAQVLEGDVELKENYALDDDEIENGYVLACQAFCKTQKVSVTFDV